MNLEAFQYYLFLLIYIFFFFTAVTTYPSEAVLRTSEFQLGFKQMIWFRMVSSAGQGGWNARLPTWGFQQNSNWIFKSRLKKIKSSTWIKFFLSSRIRKKNSIFLFKNLTYDDLFIKSVGCLDAQWIKNDVMRYRVPSPFILRMVPITNIRDLMPSHELVLKYHSVFTSLWKLVLFL